MVGITRRGAVPIPATPQLTPKDIKYRGETARITAIITDMSEIHKFSGLHLGGVKLFVIGGNIPGWFDWDAEVAAASHMYKGPKTKSTDPGILYFTSGTTGYPKMVLHSQVSYPLGHKITGKYWLGCTENDLHWVIADTGWGLTAWAGIYGPWNCGSCVFLHDSRTKFKATDVLECLRRFHVTTLCAPPTVYRMMVLEDLRQYRFEFLRRCTSAGERLDEETIRIWKKETGLTIYEGYGQTESVVLTGNFLDAKIRPGSMGKASPGFELAVLGAEGKPAKVGEEGDLVVKVKPKRPAGLFVEYWNNPDENRARFVGQWYYTGDKAYQDKDGYFWFVGRADDVILSAGYRIGPYEIESVLAEHPAVVESAAIAKPDELRGAIVKAFVVLRPGFAPSPELAAELQDYVKRTTAPYKYPREIEFVDGLPKTISGKVRRIDLRKAEEAAHAAANSGK
jgi:acyl-coenzyme A synthetase/AMP-(fatty) acid ligase